MVTSWVQPPRLTLDPTLGLYLGYIGYMLGLYCGYIGYRLELCRGYIGYMSEYIGILKQKM